MIDAPGLQVFASTAPSILTAGQLSATVTLSLNSPTAKSIIVKIPVGNGAADLIAAGTAGTIHPQLRGATGWTVQPTWTQNSPTYICDLTGKSPEPLVLILPSVTVSDKSGDARIIVSDGGESTSCTIVKYTKGFTLENFVAQPTSTKTLIPVNLSWRAKDAKSLHLAYKGTSDNLSPASTGKQVSVYESTTFRLEAVDQDDHRAHLTTHVQVTDPSLSYAT
ncbi:hypothetical protein E4K10_47220 [Streptomyces sp. T1317-0309]|nr:hypothetical protein E4K10_47220 [Streptomyces sp. T1317-0309]